MRYSELYGRICKAVPADFVLPWDNDGKMLCMDKDKEIKRVLICLDVTLDAIEYAGSNGFDLILSHHPLIFKPVNAFTWDRISAKRMALLIKYDITVMSFHTRLDVTHVNTALANALELQGISELYVEGVPMGRVGSLETPMSVDGFAKYLKEKIGAPYVEYPNIEATISRVAVLGGSGADAISEAVKAGADCLVTGECGYNKALDSADSGFPVFTAGHFYTENPVCNCIEGILKEIDSSLICEIYNSNLFKTI